jgi:O-antigen/teichoic acid export membrane protein
MLAMLSAVVASVASAWIIEPGLARAGFVGAVGVFALAQVALLQINEAWFAEGRFLRGSVTAAATAGGGLVGVSASATISADPAVLLFAQAVGNLTVSSMQLPSLQRAGLMRWSAPSGNAAVSLLRRGLPALGLTVGLAIVLRADRYLLGAVSGPAAVGIYSVAATVSETIRMLPQAIGQLFFREASLNKASSESGTNMRRAIIGAAVSAVLVGIGGWFLIEPLFGHEFSDAHFLLLILLVAELCFAPYAVASRGLLGGGWTRSAALLGASSSVLAVSCYAVAAELASALGVAVASCVVYGSMSILSWTLLRRRTEG